MCVIPNTALCITLKPSMKDRQNGIPPGARIVWHCRKNFHNAGYVKERSTDQSSI